MTAKPYIFWSRQGRKRFILLMKKEKERTKNNQYTRLSKVNTYTGRKKKSTKKSKQSTNKFLYQFPIKNIKVNHSICFLLKQLLLH